MSDDAIEAIRARWRGRRARISDARDVRALLAALDEARAEIRMLTAERDHVMLCEERARGDLADLRAEVRRLGCECGDDDACRFARERDAALARAEAAERRLVFAEEWHGPRWERLRDLLRGTEYERRACEIMANGTPSRDASGAVVYEPPTYAQQLQRAKWLAEAEAELSDDLAAMLARANARLRDVASLDTAHTAETWCAMLDGVRDEARRGALEEAIRVVEHLRGWRHDAARAALAIPLAERCATCRGTTARRNGDGLLEPCEGCDATGRVEALEP